MPAHALTPWIVTAGFAWLYYRRIRRQFGRQVYKPKRALLRIGVLALVGCGLLLTAIGLPHLAPAVALGGIAGAALGWLALRYMQVGITDGRPTYTPNPWIGGALSLLLVARLAWRWHAGAFAAVVQADGQPFGQNTSPLTFAFLAALIAYYLVSGIGLALRMRTLARTQSGFTEASTSSGEAKPETRADAP